MKRRQLIWALALALLPCLSNAADIYVYSSVALKPTRTLKDVKAIVPEEGGLRMSMADSNSEIVAWDQLAHFRFYAAEGTGVSALLPSAGLQVSSRGDALRISAPATMQRVTLEWPAGGFLCCKREYGCVPPPGDASGRVCGKGVHGRWRVHTKDNQKMTAR